MEITVTFSKDQDEQERMRFIKHLYTWVFDDHSWLPLEKAPMRWLDITHASNYPDVHRFMLVARHVTYD